MAIVLTENLLSGLLTHDGNIEMSTAELAKILLNEHGTEAAFFWVNSILRLDLLETVDDERIGKFLELTMVLQDGLSTPQIADIWDILTSFICKEFTACTYRTCIMAAKLLSVLAEAHHHRLSISLEDFQLKLKSLYSDVKLEEMGHSALSAICAFLEISFQFESDVMNGFISDLIELLPAKACVVTLSNVTTSISMECHLVPSILHNPKFWDKLLQCFNDVDCCIRKRSLFLLNLLIAIPNTSYSTDEKNIMEDLLVVLETLEETQGHLIRPVLAKIPKLYDYASEEKLDIRWIGTIFNRLMLQESKMISRWGMQLLLDLPLKAFLTHNGITVLERLLFAHLHNTYLFYRPNFVAKGDAPPIFSPLENYITKILCESDASISSQFLQSLLDFLSRTKASSTPLTMLTHILSKIKLPYKVGVNYVDQLALLCRLVLSTQPHRVKGAVQGFILQFLSKNVQINSKDMLCSFQTLLSVLFIEYTLDSSHFIWKDLSLLVKDCKADDDVNSKEVFKDFVTQELSAQKEFHTKIQGFALLLAIGDEQELFDDETLNLLFKPLLNCGMNVYVSKNLVVSTAKTINIVLEYFKGDSKRSDMLTFCQQNCSSIFENCSLFFIRRAEEIHWSKERNVESKNELKQLTYLLASLSALYILDGQSKVSMLIVNLISSLKGKEYEPLVMVQCSAIIQALIKKEVPMNSSLPESPGSLEWLLPHLSSDSLVHLESSWTCFTFLYCRMSESNCKYKICHIFTLAIDSIQKMKDPCVIQSVFIFMKHIAPLMINLNASVFCENAPYTAGVLQDFSNSATYWDLLNAFCSTMFNTSVMDNPECVETVISIVNEFKELTHSKEMVISLVVEHLSSYTSCEMRNAACYLDLLTDLSLFGVTQSREKQNQDDLTAYIEHLGSETPVNAVYKRLKKGVPFVRIQILNMLYVIIERFPDLRSRVIDFYFTSFKSLDKSALQNSLPNRTKIRIVQALLCLIPAVIKNMEAIDVTSLLNEVMMSLTLESQPSVRCFIECSACYILSKHPDAVSLVFEMMKTSQTVANSNALLSASFSILYHHCMYLNAEKLLSKPLLDETLQKITLWTCSNNHNVRSFSCCCLVLLSRVYDQNSWEIPQFYKAQIDFIKELSDYSKLLSKHLDKNVYFSKFNIIDDLCLLNIFDALPQQFNILENECVTRRELESFKSRMDYPVFSGNFMELPKPVSLEQSDYIIRFKDLTEFTSLQKKITPWQIMATNLGIEFDRGSTVKGDLVLFASLISKGNNLGGLSRTGEIFGVKTMVVNNLEILNNKDFKSLSMTSEKWINFEEVPYDTAPTIEYFKKMKRLGYTIVGVEQASDSVNLDKFPFPRLSVLVLGRERDGIPVELLRHLDVCVEIPQLGLIRSLNVHVSASIMIWEYSKQHLFTDSSLTGA